MKNITLTHKLAALASTAMLLTNVLAAGIASADSAVGTLSAGSLGAQVVSGSITLGGTVSTSYSATGLTTAAPFTVTITDNRGTAAGWTATSAVDQNFNLAGTSVKKYISGSGTTSALAGEYTGAACQAGWTATGTTPCGAMYLKVVSQSAGIPTAVAFWNTGATFDSSAAGTTGATNANVAITAGAISADGITGTFTGTWAANDVLRLSVDYLPVGTYFKATTASLTADTGFSTSGMSLPTSAGVVYSATATPRQDVSAPVGTGAGTFTYTMALEQPVHGNALNGSYNSSMTFDLASI